MSRFSLAILLLIATGAVAFFFVLPQWESVRATRAEIQRLREVNDELTAIAEQRDSLTREYNAISEADFQKLDAMAPAELKTATALVDFEALAQSNGLFLDRVDFVSGSEGAVNTAALVLPGTQLAEPIPFTLSLRGTYEAFRSFLNGLEHNLRMVDVSEVSFGSGTGTVLTVSIKGKIYYRR